MAQPEREPEPKQRHRGPEWLTRLMEEKMANGGRPDHAAAQEAVRRLDMLIAEHGQFDLGDDDVDDIIDAMGLRRNIARDWPVVPWSYWEARGAGRYRR